MRNVRTGWVTALALTLVGCATSFTGDAHVENGRAGCAEKCKGQGMQMAGMVYMGEYSSACVCEVPRGSASSSSGHDLLVGSAAGASGSAAGVIMQMRAQQQQQHNGFVFR